MAIAHRLSTSLDADVILAVEDGKIVNRRCRDMSRRARGREAECGAAHLVSKADHGASYPKRIFNSNRFGHHLRQNIVTADHHER
jgi:hypothetical protein